MTQAVLKNEITELSPDSPMSADQRREIADMVANVLADEYRMFVNTQGLHWNVEGPLFYSLHNLTEAQYREMFESIDTLAERIRALGLPAPHSLDEIAERCAAPDLAADATLQKRIEKLIADYELAVRRLSAVAKFAEEHGDIRTTDLLTQRVGVYEENAWMLRATIAS
jgi:starvation-inducible DNA-binding protein